jgi:hypothetical protein
MKPIVRRLRKLEDRFAPRINEKGQSLVEVILERRRRRAEALGEPYDDPPQNSLSDVHNRPRSLEEVLRRRPNNWGHK